MNKIEEIRESIKWSKKHDPDCTLTKSAKPWRDEIEYLLTKVDKYRKTLEFYAGTKSLSEARRLVIQDGGCRAREALEDK